MNCLWFPFSSSFYVQDALYDKLMKIVEDKGYDTSKFKKTVHLDTGDSHDSTQPDAAAPGPETNKLKNSDGGLWFLRGLFWPFSGGKR